MKWKLGLYRGYLGSSLFGDTVPNIEQDCILVLAVVFLYKEYNLTRFCHQKGYSSLKQGSFLKQLEGLIVCLSSKEESGEKSQVSYAEFENPNFDAKAGGTFSYPGFRF